MTLRHWSHGVLAVVLVGILAGCGGGSGSTASAGAGSHAGTGSQSGNGSLTGSGGNGGNSGGSQPIQGIATPQSVSVVTATNAN